MRTAQQWFDDYGVSHQNKTNKLIHWFCIPLIVFSLLGLLMSIPVPFFEFSVYINFASLFLLMALVFYIRLSFSLFLGFLFLGGLMLILNYYLFETLLYNKSYMALISLAIFVVAWIGQFIGHKIEGEKPSFFEDLQFLLIGPAWLLQFIYKKLGIKI